MTVQENILSIVSDATEISDLQYGGWVSFRSKGNDKRTKKCIAKIDNRGVALILKQVDVFKPMRYMTNGQPITNCKIVYQQ